MTSKPTVLHASWCQMLYIDIIYNCGTLLQFMRAHMRLIGKRNND